MRSEDASTPRQQTQIDFASLGIHGEKTTGSQGRSVDHVRIALDHWKRLVLGFSAGLMIGTLAYLFLGPRYVGSTRVLVSKPPGTPLQEGNVSTYGDTGGHVHLIKSHVIVERAFEKHHLGELPSLHGSEEPVTDIIDSLEVRRTAGQNRDFQSIIDINVTCPSETEALRITRAIVDAYDEYLARVRKNNTQEVLDVFAEADVRLQKEIADLEVEYQQFRQEAPILFTNPVGQQSANGTVATPTNHYLQEVDRIRKSLSAVSTRRTDTLAQIDVLNEMLASGESRQQVEHLVMMALSRPSASAGGDGPSNGGGGANVLFSGPPAKDRLDAELLRQEMDAARLRHHIGEDHPAAVKTRNAIDVIIDSYVALGLVPPNQRAEDPQSDDAGERVDLPSVYLAFLQTQLKQLDYAEAALEQELALAIREAKAASTYEIRDRQLADALARKKVLYNEMVQRLEKLDMTKEQAGFRMQPISDVRVEKSLKRVLKIVGACGILGVTFVFGLLYLQEWQDLSMKTIDEVRRFADARVMGSIPRWTASSTECTTDVSAALCYFHRPGSREAEAYRSVRTTLFVNTDDREDHVIQVSSPEPGDGKTTTAANLAIAVAQSGKRVLLIDCDLRRPDVHSLFGVSLTGGVADVLRKEVEWRNAVRETIVDGLCLLTAGDTPENPAELLSTPGFARMLKEVRREYDYVFIDTPPILAVSDPCITSPHADGMLLVVRMQKNKRPAVVRTREILDSHGVPLYGVIANDAEDASDCSNAYEQYARCDASAGAASVSKPIPSTEDPVGTA